MDSKKRVSYFYNSDIGKFHYGSKHLMNPKRISMAHSLIIGFGIYKELDVYKSREASKEEILQFHD
jgi:histone deacetylase 1/2